MEQLGKVHDWNDERGFGFIAPLEPTANGGRTFFHIRDYQQAGRRPEAGELVKYLATAQTDGRWRATRVRRAVTRPVPKAASTPRPLGSNAVAAAGFAALILLPAYCVLLGWAIRAGKLPLEFAFAISLLCLLTFMAYVFDKRAAQGDRQRVPETHLHLLELAGGWPGALLAQRVIRHKNRKRRYQAGFWVMVVLNLLATLAWMRWRS